MAPIFLYISPFHLTFIHETPVQIPHAPSLEVILDKYIPELRRRKLLISSAQTLARLQTTGIAHGIKTTLINSLEQICIHIRTLSQPYTKGHKKRKLKFQSAASAQLVLHERISPYCVDYVEKVMNNPVQYLKILREIPNVLPSNAAVDANKDDYIELLFDLQSIDAMSRMQVPLLESALTKNIQERKAKNLSRQRQLQHHLSPQKIIPLKAKNDARFEGQNQEETGDEKEEENDDRDENESLVGQMDVFPSLSSADIILSEKVKTTLGKKARILYDFFHPQFYEKGTNLKQFLVKQSPSSHQVPKK